ncbi:AAA family ATPase [Qingshengfaniella alkalisoli]|uniref:AAA family ATPase n=1 Tax=Qingshengfaniella alkalisoli TaxID=2599296 RepID=UPI00143D3757|nr:AAA family ATPase [Qingshengfaniella alkalisoli]
MSDHFFVVTGGPGAGKTSLITELARRGFHSTHESGRAIIREEMASGGDALPWADRMACAERMLERDLRTHSAAQALSDPVIFDHGIPDMPGLPEALRPPRAAPPHRSGQDSPLQSSRLSGTLLG